MKQKKTILLFQSGEPTHFDKKFLPMRLVNLSNLLSLNGYNVKIITPLFSHQEKKFRKKKDYALKYKNINYIFLNSPGYDKNISLRRLYDHIILAKNLWKALKRLNNIDYVVSGYPPVESCFVLSIWCKKNKIPLMIDYKDFWPETFTYNKNFLFKFLAIPLIVFYYILRNYSLKYCKSILTISNSFLDNLDNDLKKKKIVGFLTKEKQNIINLKKINNLIKIRFKNKKKKIIFIGTFMTDTFDFKTLAKLKKFIENSDNLEFHFFGFGPSKSIVMDILKFKNIFFYNSVNKQEVNYILRKAYAVYLPIKNRLDFSKSIPNKIVDAIQFKVPIITCLKGETEKLIKRYKIGFVYKSHSDLLLYLKKISKKEVSLKIKKNYLNSKLDKLFNHDKNYERILSRIKSDLNN